MSQLSENWNLSEVGKPELVAVTSLWKRWQVIIVPSLIFSNAQTFIGRMGRQRDVDEGDQVEAERLAGEIGVVARDHLFFLQPHPPPRALRGRQADQVGQLLVGQAAVVLQRAEDFEVEAVD